MLYFAYGSNLSHKQLTKRCPSSVFVAHAVLKGYRFLFSGYSARWGSSVANIREDNTSHVTGALFEMSENDLMHLAKLEGSQGYMQIEVKVEYLGNFELASSFISNDIAPGTPSESYINTMKLGANDCNLPKGYIDLLEK